MPHCFECNAPAGYGHKATCSQYHRALAFIANPMLADFVSCALQDLQLTENDEACTDGREPRDSGTIDELAPETFDLLRAICDQFRADNFEAIERALEFEPGDENIPYGKHYITHERLGSTLWLAVTGSGVTFTDDGNAPELEQFAEWARAHRVESLYFGDDEIPYFMG